MKMFYLTKSLSAFLVLLTGPRVLEIELARHRLFGLNATSFFNFLVQVLFAVALFVWVTRAVNRKKKSSAFLTMSCVSKKVLHRDRWIPVEQYLCDQHNILVSHGMTPEECADWKRQALDEIETLRARAPQPVEAPRFAPSPNAVPRRPLPAAPLHRPARAELALR